MLTFAAFTIALASVSAVTSKLNKNFKKEGQNADFLAGTKPTGYVVNTYYNNPQCTAGTNNANIINVYFYATGLCVVQDGTSSTYKYVKINSTYVKEQIVVYATADCTGTGNVTESNGAQTGGCYQDSGDYFSSVWQPGSSLNLPIAGREEAEYVDSKCSVVVSGNRYNNNYCEQYITLQERNMETTDALYANKNTCIDGPYVFYTDSQCTKPYKSDSAAPSFAPIVSKYPTLTPSAFVSCYEDNYGYAGVGVSGYEETTCAAASGSSSSSDSAKCFSADETVTLKSGVIKTMKEVVLGDEVLVASMDRSGAAEYYSKVIALPHDKDNQESAVFVQLTTASGRDIKMTADHLLMGGSCDAAVDMSLVTADSLSVNDCVMSVSGREVVVSKREVSGRGVHTVVVADASKLLVVNGVVASPFAVNHVLTNAFYNIHRVLPTATAASQSVLNELADMALSVFA